MLGERTVKPPDGPSLRVWWPMTAPRPIAAPGGPTRSPCTVCSAGSGHCQPAAWGQQTSRTLGREYADVRCIDAADVRWQVERTLRWVNPDGFDVPGIVADIIHTSGW